MTLWSATGREVVLTLWLCLQSLYLLLSTSVWLSSVCVLFLFPAFWYTLVFVRTFPSLFMTCAQTFATICLESSGIVFCYQRCFPISLLICGSGLLEPFLPSVSPIHQLSSYPAFWFMWYYQYDSLLHPGSIFTGVSLVFQTLPNSTWIYGFHPYHVHSLMLMLWDIHTSSAFSFQFNFFLLSPDENFIVTRPRILLFASCFLLCLDSSWPV